MMNTTLPHFLRFLSVARLVVLASLAFPISSLATIATATVATPALSSSMEAHSGGNTDAGWTPVLLQLGWSGMDSVDSSDFLPAVYGLALGLFSVSADNVVGADMALGLPATRETVWGAQAGLFGAIVAHRMNGIQIGGVFTGAEHVSGVSFGGMMSAARRLDGIALAGLFASAETGRGIVASLGFTDTGNATALANAPTKPFTGIQLAGIANFGADVRGVQLATIFNFAGELHGVQIGLFNRAFTGRGAQIGLVNIFGRDEHTVGMPLLHVRF